MKGEAYEHFSSNRDDDQFKAEEVRLSLMKMQKDYLIDLEDAVVAVKDQNGKGRLHQAVNLTAAGAVSGGFWGSLIGLMFLNPLLGMAMGAAAGAVSGALTDVGIHETNEGVSGNDEAGQFDAVRSCEEGHAG